MQSLRMIAAFAATLAILFAGVADAKGTPKKKLKKPSFGAKFLFGPNMLDQTVTYACEDDTNTCSNAGDDQDELLNASFGGAAWYMHPITKEIKLGAQVNYISWKTEQDDIRNTWIDLDLAGWYQFRMAPPLEIGYISLTAGYSHLLIDYNGFENGSGFNVGAFFGMEFFNIPTVFVEVGYLYHYTFFVRPINETQPEGPAMDASFHGGQIMLNLGVGF